MSDRTDVESACARIVREAQHFQIPGMSEAESIKLICKVAGYLHDKQVGAGGGGFISPDRGRPDAEAIAQAIMLMRRTSWPQRQIGSLQHIVSVDNGANSWELWRDQDGELLNWYAVTGADRDKLDKA